MGRKIVCGPFSSFEKMQMKSGLLSHIWLAATAAQPLLCSKLAEKQVLFMHGHKYCCNAYWELAHDAEMTGRLPRQRASPAVEAAAGRGRALGSSECGLATGLPVPLC